jgi:hypothetical protein
MFQLEQEGTDDFLFLFESIQDIAELDSSTSPSSIQIYQVKKKDRGEWHWKDLTHLLEPNQKKASAQSPSIIKNSPIGKLYSSVLEFKSLNSTGKFISNAGCNLKLHDGSNAATSISCDLSRLENSYLEPLKISLKTLHGTENPLVDPSLIHLEKAPIHPDSPLTYLRGIVTSFLNVRSPKHAGQASSLVDALLAQIGPLGAKTDTCSNFDELKKERGYSRNEFIHALSTLEIVPDEESIINDLLNQLFSEGYINFADKIKIRIATANIFRKRIMGATDLSTKSLTDDLDIWIKKNTLGAKLGAFIDAAKEDLCHLHPSVSAADFIANLLLEVTKKCVDQT